MKILIGLNLNEILYIYRFLKAVKCIIQNKIMIKLLLQKNKKLKVNFFFI